MLESNERLTVDKKKNILISTCGITCAIPKEVIAYVCPQSSSLFSKLKIKKIISSEEDAADECWFIITEDAKAKALKSKVEQWLEGLPSKKKPLVKFILLPGVQDIDSEESIKQARGSILRIVLSAHQNADGGKVYLSLTGGRKTMGSDMQEAATLFGHHGLFHIIDILREIPKEEWKGSFSKSYCFPFITAHEGKLSPIGSKLKEKFQNNKISERGDHFWQLENPHECGIDDELKRMKKESANLFSNYQEILEGESNITNYSFLYTLPPHIIKKLKKTTIGQEGTKEEKEQHLAFLRKVPKGDLHCHLGGLLTPDEMIKVAQANREEFNRLCKGSQKLKNLYNDVQRILQQGGVKALRKKYPEMRAIRSLCDDVPPPFSTIAFLLPFEENPLLLEEYIYAGLLNNRKGFKKIGIKKYEILGDLQGSALLQNEISIRKTLSLYLSKICEEGVTYLELRCSPANYTKGGLGEKEVLNIIHNACEKFSEKCKVNLLIIGSRHRKQEELEKHINLAVNNMENIPIVGFDFAGNEEKGLSPHEVRREFKEVMKESMKITIHAGEGEDVRNIWEAIYELNASRIGHGLTLEKDEKLLHFVIDRKVGIELCPSSNEQICGAEDYPVKRFLEQGVKVSVNTDDPGISLTTLSEEYYKAAELAGGLSLWEVFSLSRNSFLTSFAKRDDKKELIHDAEELIGKLLEEDERWYQ